MNNLVVLVLLLVIVCHGPNTSRAHTDVQRSSSSRSSDCQLYGSYEGSADITMWRNGLALHVTPTLAEYALRYG